MTKVSDAVFLLLFSMSASAQDCGWSALPGPDETGTAHEVRALEVFDDGSGPALYAGGFFDSAGGVEVNGVARWDGDAWSALIGPGGVGVNRDRVYALAVYDDGTGSALYVGGDFTEAGGHVVNGIARWDGTDWTPLAGPGGVGVEFFVNDMAVFNDGGGADLYVAGRFFTAGGVPVAHVARWDGQSWSALQGSTGGPGLNNVARALAVFNDGTGDALYVGGDFTMAGGQLANRVVKWNGTEFIPLTGPSGNGTSDPVLGLGVYNDGLGDDLYVGGFFTSAGGQTVNGIARWTGSQWVPLVGPDGTGVSPGGGVASLRVFDDGSGEALFVGGDFAQAGGETVNGIARWNGSGWSALSSPGGVGVSNFVNALAVFNDGSGLALYAGGLFDSAGSVPVGNVARWSCGQSGECDADLTGDGTLDFFDVAAFVSLFENQDPAADFNGDGDHDFFDFAAFIGAFNQGCE